MAPSITQTISEQAVAELIASMRVPRAQALVLLAMAQYDYRRPEDDLVEILRRLPRLEDKRSTADAVTQLIHAGLLVRLRSGALEEVRLADARAQPLLTAELGRVAPTAPPVVHGTTVLGTPRGGDVYGTFLSLVGNAQREILLWIASASSYRAVLPLLVQRAEAGVKVKVLLADVEAVESVRGAVSTGLARETIADWKAAFRGRPNAQVRLYPKGEDFVFSGSTCIDGKVLRIVVYDWRRQRGMDGEFVEFVNPVGLELNVFEVYRARFEHAWRRANRLSGLVNALRWLWRFDAEIVLGAFLVYAYYRSDFWTADPKNKDLVVGVVGSAGYLLVSRVGIALARIVRKRLGHED
jgi:hypothetical protein